MSEPSQKMLDAGVEQLYLQLEAGTSSQYVVTQIYEAMIAAKAREVNAIFAPYEAGDQSNAQREAV